MFLKFFSYLDLDYGDSHSNIKEVTYDFHKKPLLNELLLERNLENSILLEKIENIIKHNKNEEIIITLEPHDDRNKKYYKIGIKKLNFV